MRPAHNLARVAALALLAGAALFAAPAAVQQNARTREFVTVGGRRAASGEVLVKFRRQLASFERGQLDQQTDADQNHSIGSTGVRRMHSRRYDTQTLLEFLRNHPDVEYVEPNYVIEADALPDDPMFGQLWGLRNTGQKVGVNGIPGADIGASLAWTCRRDRPPRWSQ